MDWHLDIHAISMLQAITTAFPVVVCLAATWASKGLDQAPPLLEDKVRIMNATPVGIAIIPANRCSLITFKNKTLYLLDSLTRFVRQGR
jgi:hypothetical protein